MQWGEFESEQEIEDWIFSDWDFIGLASAMPSLRWGEYQHPESLPGPPEGEIFRQVAIPYSSRKDNTGFCDLVLVQRIFEGEDISRVRVLLCELKKDTIRPRDFCQIGRYLDFFHLSAMAKTVTEMSGGTARTVEEVEVFGALIAPELSVNAMTIANQCTAVVPMFVALDDGLTDLVPYGRGAKLSSEVFEEARDIFHRFCDGEGLDFSNGGKHAWIVPKFRTAFGVDIYDWMLRCLDSGVVVAPTPRVGVVN